MLLVLGAGAMLTLTLSPGEPIFPATRFEWCSWPPPSLWDSVTSLRTLNTRSLNALMFAPIGLACALSRSRPVVVGLVGGAAAVPFLIEFSQYALPIHRGCDATDVLDNLVGLALGVLIGLLLRPLTLRLWRRPKPPGTPAADTA